MKVVPRLAVVAVSVGVVTFAATSGARAQPPATASEAQTSEVQGLRDEVDRLKQQLQTLQQQYDDRLKTLEERLGTQQPTPTPPPTPTPVPAPPDQPTAPGQLGSSVNPGSSKVFNPDMSVIGNFVGIGGKNDMSSEPSLQLTEAEAAFQAVVDPYARADFFLSAGPDGLEVEEGFVTFTALPAQMLLKVGKMRAQFGKVNTLHTHAMPTADRPLVTQNLVGGEEGLSDSGLSLSHLIQNKLIFLEATGEVYAGTSEVFRTSKRSRLNYVGHVRAYRDLTEATNIDLGSSIAFGPTEGLLPDDILARTTGTPSLDKRLVGVDATFRYRPLRRAIYQRLNLRTELIWSKQDLPLASSSRAFGAYGLGEYQFAQRWYAGVRFDHSGRVFDGSLTDNGGSVFVTFWPTEFSQVRTQYRRTNYAEGVNGNEFLFQFNFSIGAHGAHAF